MAKPVEPMTQKSAILIRFRASDDGDDHSPFEVEEAIRTSGTPRNEEFTRKRRQTLHRFILPALLMIGVASLKFQ